MELLSSLPIPLFSFFQQCFNASTTPAPFLLFTNLVFLIPPSAHVQKTLILYFLLFCILKIQHIHFFSVSHKISYVFILHIFEIFYDESMIDTLVSETNPHYVSCPIQIFLYVFSEDNTSTNTRIKHSLFLVSHHLNSQSTHHLLKDILQHHLACSNQMNRSIPYICSHFCSIPNVFYDLSVSQDLLFQPLFSVFVSEDYRDCKCL